MKGWARSVAQISRRWYNLCNTCQSTECMDVPMLNSLLTSWWKGMDVFHHCHPLTPTSRRQILQRNVQYVKQNRNIKLDTIVPNVIYHCVWHLVLNSTTPWSIFESKWLQIYDVDLNCAVEWSYSGLILHECPAQGYILGKYY